MLPARFLQLSWQPSMRICTPPELPEPGSNCSPQSLDRVILLLCLHSIPCCLPVQYTAPRTCALIQIRMQNRERHVSQMPVDTSRAERVKEVFGAVQTHRMLRS
jgi:hypothetical protein